MLGKRKKQKADCISSRSESTKVSLTRRCVVDRGYKVIEANATIKDRALYGLSLREEYSQRDCQYIPFGFDRTLYLGSIEKLEAVIKVLTDILEDINEELVVDNQA